MSEYSVRAILLAWVTAIFGNRDGAPKGVWYVEWSDPPTAAQHRRDTNFGRPPRGPVVGVQDTVFWFRSTAENKIAWGVANLPWGRGPMTWRVRLCTEYALLSSGYEARSGVTS